MFANIVLLLIAGHENLTSLIGNGAALLMELPDVRTELARDPSRWPAAVEELLRLVSPNQFIRRQVREDVAVGEQVMRAGDPLLLILAAANRDPKWLRKVRGEVERLCVVIQRRLVIMLIVPASSLTTEGTNAAMTSRRSRVWSGGSVKTRQD